MAIHPTAIISPKAELDSSVEVGPNAIIEEHVRIGAGTRIWANAYLTGHTEIGRDNVIHMGAVIGHEPQDLKFDRTCRTYLRDRGPQCVPRILQRPSRHGTRIRHDHRQRVLPHGGGPRRVTTA